MRFGERGCASPDTLMAQGNARLGNGKKLYENGKSRAARGRRWRWRKEWGFVPSFYDLARGSHLSATSKRGHTVRKGRNTVKTPAARNFIPGTSPSDARRGTTRPNVVSLRLQRVDGGGTYTHTHTPSRKMGRRENVGSFARESTLPAFYRQALFARARPISLVRPFTARYYYSFFRSLAFRATHHIARACCYSKLFGRSIVRPLFRRNSTGHGSSPSIGTTRSYILSLLIHG